MYVKCSASKEQVLTGCYWTNEAANRVWTTPPPPSITLPSENDLQKTEQGAQFPMKTA